MAAQFEIVTQLVKNPNQATKKVAFFDSSGDPVELAPTSLEEGTLADLTTGTDETPKVWSAKTIADYVASIVNA